MKLERALLVTWLLMGCCIRAEAQSRIQVFEGPYFGQEPPGTTPVLFAPELFDAEHGYHSTVIFSPDLTEAVWSPMERDGVLLFSKMVDGVWTSPRKLDFGMSGGAGDPGFSPDGDRLYFQSFHPPQPGAEERERIWFVRKKGTGWSDPEPIDQVIRAHPTHWTFSFAKNGNLYFTSEIEGVRGEQDIFVSRFDGQGYQEPEDLGTAINSEGKDLAPFIAPDESYLLFTRVGKNTAKGDLYISFRTLAGTWTPAIDLGPTINTVHHDLCPSLSPDGRYIFFISQREGLSRIYWVDAGVIEKLRPENRDRN